MVAILLKVVFLIKIYAMKNLVIAFAVIACFGSCKKEPTHYCYNVFQDSLLNNTILLDTRFEKRFKNEDESRKYQTENNVYCEAIK